MANQRGYPTRQSIPSIWIPGTFSVCYILLALTYAQDGRQILLEANKAMLGLAPDLDYSQAALSYGSHMEAVTALEMKFEQVLESFREQFICIQFLAHNICKLTKL